MEYEANLSGRLIKFNEERDALLRDAVPSRPFCRGTVRRFGVHGLDSVALCGQEGARMLWGLKGSHAIWRSKSLF